jgi:transposase
VDRHGHREVSRARIVPGDRAAVRAFFEPFRGAGLEVALEATTGWRFVVEELQRVNAEVHLAEAAEASALKGKKRRAKTDFADARHLRELLLIGRIPESWIPPVVKLPEAGDESMSYPVQVLVVEIESRRVTDSGLSPDYPDLASVGPVVIDYRGSA